MAKIYMATKADVETLGNNIAPLVQSEIDAAYQAVELAGGIIPSSQSDRTLANLPNVISTLPTNDIIDIFVSQVASGQITQTVASRAVYVRNYALAFNINLTSINMPNAVTIGIHAFDGCTSLTTVSLPNVLTAQDYAFNGCTSIVTLNLPKLTSVGLNTFSGCTALENLIVGAGARLEYASAWARNTPNLKRIIAPSPQAIGIITGGHPGADVPDLGAILDVRPMVGSAAIIACKNFLSQPTAGAKFRVYCEDGYLQYVDNSWVLLDYDSEVDGTYDKPWEA